MAILEDDIENRDNPQNEDEPQNEDDIKNEDDKIFVGRSYPSQGYHI